MINVQDLIDKQRAINAANEPPPVRSSFDKLLDRQRDAIENRWESLDILLGGELLPLEIGAIYGSEWCDLTAVHPPQAQQDIDLGYNRNTLPRDYPTSRIKIDGTTTTDDTWHAVWDLLDADNRANISAVIWGINWGEPEAALKTALRVASEREAENAERD